MTGIVGKCSKMEGERTYVKSIRVHLAAGSIIAAHTVALMEHTAIS